jgi:hypothetical protein
VDDRSRRNGLYCLAIAALMCFSFGVGYAQKRSVKEWHLDLDGDGRLDRVAAPEERHPSGSPAMVYRAAEPERGYPLPQVKPLPGGEGGFIGAAEVVSTDDLLPLAGPESLITYQCDAGGDLAGPLERDGFPVPLSGAAAQLAGPRYV